MSGKMLKVSSEVTDCFFFIWFQTLKRGTYFGCNTAVIRCQHKFLSFFLYIKMICFACLIFWLFKVLVTSPGIARVNWSWLICLLHKLSFIIWCHLHLTMTYRCWTRMNLAPSKPNHWLCDWHPLKAYGMVQ